MSLATQAPSRCSRSSSSRRETSSWTVRIALAGRAAAIAAIVLATLSARGESAARTYTWMTFEEIARHDFRTGERIEVIGRYVELQENEIVLFQSTGRFVIEDPRILREVFTLSTVESNLVFRAVCVDPGGKEPTFEVEHAALATDDKKVFEMEIEKLRRLGKRGVEPLFELARRIHATEVKLEKAELRPLARAAAAAGLELQEKRLSPDDFRSRLGAVRKLHDIMEDRNFTMQFLVALEKRYPQAGEVREFLIEIGCRRFDGRWMTYDAFKRLQGFVKAGKRWLRPEEKDFLELLEAFARLRGDPILRRMMQREYQLLSNRGDVAIGMRREEVYHALGFPDRVYRRRFRGKVFDQWVYGGRYYYFLDGLLLKHPLERN